MRIARILVSLLAASFVGNLSGCIQVSSTKHETITTSPPQPSETRSAAVAGTQRPVAATMVSGDDASSIRLQLAELDNSSPIMNPERKNDVEYAAVFRARESLFAVERIQLIGQLWRAEPNATDLDDLMQYRWENSRRIPDLTIADEVDAYAAAHPRSVDTIAAGRFQIARGAVMKLVGQPATAITAADEFITRYPDDVRGADLLAAASSRMEDDQKAAVNDRIATHWPNSTQGKRILAERRRNAAVGTPFELAFNDHLTGRPVNMAMLRGKVVVIDFWATWCGPCKEEIPHMKELYKTYHDSGLEIVGVSLDQSPEKNGDEKLISYCHEHELTWPQYYQGNYWDSEFSRGWGINSIPAMFVVDKQGILRTVNARGQLDDLIPQMLAEPGTE